MKATWDELCAGDEVAVHEARKLSRRAQAELRVSDAGGRKRRAWRDLRRAAAPLRDHDVTGEHLRAALTELGVEDSTLAYFDQTWAERRSRLLAQTVWPERPRGFDLKSGWRKEARHLAERDGRHLLKQGQAALNGGEPQAWHDWRKRLKRYRYTLELLGQVPPVLTEVLKALGRLQDAELVLALLHAEPALLRYERARLIAREEAARHAAQERVRELFPALTGLFPVQSGD
ncbi:CHAD domain-containing protein [Deinococcus hopiensis]|nr:CHAD domain-containing protein [Deinococcus hopiensis]